MPLTPLLGLTILLFGAALGALLVSLCRSAFRTRIMAEVEKLLTKGSHGDGSATALPKQHVIRSAGQHPSDHRSASWRKTYVRSRQAQ